MGVIVIPAVPLAVIEDPITLAKRPGLKLLVEDVMGRAENCHTVLILDTVDPRIDKPA